MEQIYALAAGIESILNNNAGRFCDSLEYKLEDVFLFLMCSPYCARCGFDIVSVNMALEMVALFLF